MTPSTAWKTTGVWVKTRPSDCYPEALVPSPLVMMIRVFGAVIGASHGKSLWASIPPRMSVYLHNLVCSIFLWETLSTGQLGHTQAHAHTHRHAWTHTHTHTNNPHSTHTYAWSWGHDLVQTKRSVEGWSTWGFVKSSHTGSNVGNLLISPPCYYPSR